MTILLPVAQHTDQFFLIKGNIAIDPCFTYAGFCVFGIGHILYIVGMLLSYYPAGRPMTVIVPVLLALVLSIGNAVLEKPMKRCLYTSRSR